VRSHYIYRRGRAKVQSIDTYLGGIFDGRRKNYPRGLLWRDAGPDALTSVREQSSTHQTFNDAGRRLRRNLERIPECVYRDEGRPAVDDFLENGSDDLGTARRVATVCFHKASLRSRGW
jgi:hypothetical protein